MLHFLAMRSSFSSISKRIKNQFEFFGIRIKIKIEIKINPIFWSILAYVLDKSFDFVLAVLVMKYMS